MEEPLDGCIIFPAALREMPLTLLQFGPLVFVHFVRVLASPALTLFLSLAGHPNLGPQFWLTAQHSCYLLSTPEPGLMNLVSSGQAGAGSIIVPVGIS